MLHAHESDSNSLLSIFNSTKSGQRSPQFLLQQDESRTEHETENYTYYIIIETHCPYQWPPFLITCVISAWFVKLEKNTRDHQWTVIKWKMEPKINIGN